MSAALITPWNWLIRAILHILPTGFAGRKASNSCNCVPLREVCYVLRLSASCSVALWHRSVENLGHINEQIFCLNPLDYHMYKQSYV